MMLMMMTMMMMMMMMMLWSFDKAKHQHQPFADNEYEVRCRLFLNLTTIRDFFFGPSAMTKDKLLKQQLHIFAVDQSDQFV